MWRPNPQDRPAVAILSDRPFLGSLADFVQATPPFTAP